MNDATSLDDVAACGGGEPPPAAAAADDPMVFADEDDYDVQQQEGGSGRVSNDTANEYNDEDDDNGDDHDEQMIIDDEQVGPTAETNMAEDEQERNGDAAAAAAATTHPRPDVETEEQQDEGLNNNTDSHSTAGGSADQNDTGNDDENVVGAGAAAAAAAAGGASAAGDDDDDSEEEREDSSNNGGGESSSSEQDDSDDDDDDGGDGSSDDDEDESSDDEDDDDDDDEAPGSSRAAARVTTEDGHELSEYELLRQERIERNKRYLAQLGLEGKDGNGILAGKKPDSNANKKKKKVKPVEPAQKRSTLSRQSKAKAISYGAGPSVAQLIKEHESKDDPDGKPPAKKEKKLQDGDKKIRPRSERVPRFIYDELKSMNKHHKELLRQAQRDVKTAEKDIKFWGKRAKISAKREHQLARHEKHRLERERIEQIERQERQQFGGTMRELLQQIDARMPEISNAVALYDAQFDVARLNQEQELRRLEGEEKMKTIDALQRFPRVMKQAVSLLNSTLTERAPKDPPPPRRSKRAHADEDVEDVKPAKSKKTRESDQSNKADDNNWSCMRTGSDDQIAHTEKDDTDEGQDGNQTGTGNTKVRKRSARNVGGWVSPEFAHKLKRQWLERDTAVDKFDLATFAPQIGDVVLYYPSGHLTHLQTYPDALGKRLRISSRVPLWEKAASEKQQTLNDGNGPALSGWWNEQWLSSVEKGCAIYPILCRVERTHAEFPPDPHSKVVKKDSSGAVQVSFQGPKTQHATRGGSHQLRLAVSLRPLAPLLPPPMGDSLALPPMFTVVVFPSPMKPFLVPFSWAFAISHSLALDQTVSVRAVCEASGVRVNSKALVRSFRTMDDESSESFRLDDKLDMIEKVLDQCGRTSYNESAVEKALSDPRGRGVLPVSEACTVLDTFKRFSAAHTKSNPHDRGQNGCPPINLADLIYRTLPLWDGISVIRDLFDRKPRSISPWEAVPTLPKSASVASIDFNRLAVFRTELDEALISKIECLIEDLGSKGDGAASHFSAPVTDSVAPSYSCAVPVGMCFEKILRRMKMSKGARRRCYYRSVDEVVSDIGTILDNCLLYNDPTSDLAQIASSVVTTLKQDVVRIANQHVRELRIAKKADEERRQLVLAQSGVDESSQLGERVDGARTSKVIMNTVKEPHNEPVFQDWLHQTAGCVSGCESAIWVPQAGDRVVYSRRLHQTFVTGHYRSLEPDQCTVINFRSKVDGPNRCEDADRIRVVSSESVQQNESDGSTISHASPAEDRRKPPSSQKTPPGGDQSEDVNDNSPQNKTLPAQCPDPRNIEQGEDSNHLGQAPHEETFAAAGKSNESGEGSQDVDEAASTLPLSVESMISPLGRSPGKDQSKQSSAALDICSASPKNGDTLSPQRSGCDTPTPPKEIVSSESAGLAENVTSVINGRSKFSDEKKETDPHVSDADVGQRTDASMEPSAMDGEPQVVQHSSPKSNEGDSEDWVSGAVRCVQATFPKPVSTKSGDDAATFCTSSPLLLVSIEFKTDANASPHVAVVHWRPCLFASDSNRGCKCPTCGLTSPTSFLHPEWMHVSSETGFPMGLPNSMTVKEIESIDRCMTILKHRCLHKVPPSFVDSRLTKNSVKKGYFPQPANVGIDNTPLFENLFKTGGGCDADDTSFANFSGLIESAFLPACCESDNDPKLISANKERHGYISPWYLLSLELVHVRLKKGYYRQRSGILNDISEAFATSVFLLLSEEAGRKKEPISVRRIAKSLASSKGRQTNEANSEAAQGAAASTEENGVLRSEATWASRISLIRELYATAWVSVSDTDPSLRMLGVVERPTVVFAPVQVHPSRAEARRKLQRLMSAFKRDQCRNAFGLSDPAIPKFPLANVRVVCSSTEASTVYPRRSLAPGAASSTCTDGGLISVRIPCGGYPVLDSSSCRALADVGGTKLRVKVTCGGVVVPMDVRESRPTISNDPTTEDRVIQFGFQDYEGSDALVRALFGRPDRMAPCGRCQAFKKPMLVCRLRRGHSNPDFDWSSFFTQDASGIDGIIRQLDGLPPIDPVVESSLALDNSSMSASNQVADETDIPKEPQTESKQDGGPDPRQCYDKAEKALLLAQKVFLSAQTLVEAPMRLSKEFIVENYPIDPDDGHYMYCVVCGLSGDLLCCDGCANVVHNHCVSLPAIPDGDWFCEECVTKNNGNAPHCDADNQGGEEPACAKQTGQGTSQQEDTDDQGSKEPSSAKETETSTSHQGDADHHDAKDPACAKATVGLDASTPGEGEPAATKQIDRQLPFGRVEFDFENADKLSSLLEELRAARPEPRYRPKSLGCEQLTDVVDFSAEGAIPGVPPMKKKRGRPRKYPVQVEARTDYQPTFLDLKRRPTLVSALYNEWSGIDEYAKDIPGGVKVLNSIDSWREQWEGERLGRLVKVERLAAAIDNTVARGAALDSVLETLQEFVLRGSLAIGDKLEETEVKRALAACVRTAVARSSKEEDEEVPAAGHVDSKRCYYAAIEDDTVDIVAGKLGCDWEQLAQEPFNKKQYGKLSRRTRFKQNTILRIPASCSKQSVDRLLEDKVPDDLAAGCFDESGRYYATEEDETLSSIAESVGCDPRLLVALNQKLHGRLNARSRFRSGTILRVPQKEVNRKRGRAGSPSDGNSKRQRVEGKTGKTQDRDQPDEVPQGRAPRESEVTSIDSFVSVSRSGRSRQPPKRFVEEKFTSSREAASDRPQDASNTKRNRSRPRRGMQDDIVSITSSNSVPGRPGAATRRTTKRGNKLEGLSVDTKEMANGMSPLVHRSQN